MALTPTTFYGGSTGIWLVEEIRAICGESLSGVARLSMQASSETIPAGVRWWLRGVANHERDTHRAEREALWKHAPVLSRAESNCAAMIAVRRTQSWWQLTDRERQDISEQRSARPPGGVRLLPAIARRLYQCRELGEQFDFITWFEFAPCDSGALDDLVGSLRGSDEWKYIDREVDVRLRLADE